MHIVHRNEEEKKICMQNENIWLSRICDTATWLTFCCCCFSAVCLSSLAYKMHTIQLYLCIYEKKKMTEAPSQMANGRNVERIESIHWHGNIVKFDSRNESSIVWWESMQTVTHIDWAFSLLRTFDIDAFFVVVDVVVVTSCRPGAELMYFLVHTGIVSIMAPSGCFCARTIDARIEMFEDKWWKRVRQRQWKRSTQKKWRNEVEALP